ncbi:SGF29 tudor-like domain-containing protein [Paraphysoderma sedebokerense]|nr:SGF29 tudor-like domain-containing protein [Paraphysoderma sedebokerense]
MDRSKKSRSSDSTPEEPLWWKAVCSSLHLLDTAHNLSNDSLTTCRSEHANLLSSNNGSTEAWQNLLQSYKTALEKVKDEQKHLASTSESLVVLTAIKTAPESVPPHPLEGPKRATKKRKSEGNIFAPSTLKKSKTGTASTLKLPPFDFPSQIYVGCNVAVRIGDDWILAVVTAVDHDKQIYEVEDADNTTSVKTYTVESIDMLPLPSDTVKLPEFPLNSDVFACYPETTAFYFAKVLGTPSKPNPKRPQLNGKYVLKFEDDQNQTQYVPADMVTGYLPPRGNSGSGPKR